MIRLPPSSTRTDTLFPYTTLFRSGDPTSVAIAGVAHRTLLVFLSSGCLTCQDFSEAFSAPASLGLRADVRPVIVVTAPSHESLGPVQALAPATVRVVLPPDPWAAYTTPVAPHSVLATGTTHRTPRRSAPGPRGHAPH